MPRENKTKQNKWTNVLCQKLNRREMDLSWRNTAMSQAGTQDSTSFSGKPKVLFYEWSIYPWNCAKTVSVTAFLSVRHHSHLVCICYSNSGNATRKGAICDTYLGIKKKISAEEKQLWIQDSTGDSCTLILDACNLYSIFRMVKMESHVLVCQ